MIGCGCKVCTSDDPRDQRLRTAALLRIGDTNIGIDCGPDFRQQMLRARASHLDAILLTHQHNDHVVGLDDVRPFNFRSGQSMPIYATVSVQEELKRRFAYAFDANPYPGAPRFDLYTIDKDTPFQVDGIQVTPVEVMHGRMPVLGFRIGHFTYLTDVKTISQRELQKIKGSKVLVTSALHHTLHYSHANLEEAIELAQLIGAERTYFTHMSHSMGLYEEINPTLPQGMALAYDGLEIELS